MKRYIFKFIKLIKLVKCSLYFNALRKGAAAAVEHEKLLYNLSQNNIKTVVDIGANRGQFSLVSRSSFSNAKIYAFEPLSTASNIYRSVFEEDNNVTLYESAIGPHTKESIIHVSMRDDSSSLLAISELQNKLFPGTAELKEQKINVTTLHDVLSEDEIDEPALLKLDVQGYELQALAGCEQLLHKFSYVYVECSFMELYEGQAMASDVIDYLKNKKYILVGIYGVAYDTKGIAVQGDFLFIRTNHM